MASQGMKRTRICGEFEVRLSLLNHKYSARNIITNEEITNGIKSVTTIISDLYEKFDPDKAISILSDTNRKLKYFGLSDADIKKMWLVNGKNCGMLGSQMHEILETFLNSRMAGRDELPIVDKNIITGDHLNQIRDYFISKDLQVIGSEIIVFDSKTKIAGCLDCLVRYGNTEKFGIIDWKRRKTLSRHNFFDTHLSLFEDNEYTKVKIQLNLYRYLLGNKNVNTLICISAHPEAKLLIDEIPVDEEMTECILKSIPS